MWQNVWNNFMKEVLKMSSIDIQNGDSLGFFLTYSLKFVSMCTVSWNSLEVFLKRDIHVASHILRGYFNKSSW